MTEFVLAYRKRTDKAIYVVGSHRQGALELLIQYMEHFAGDFSYVMFNSTLRQLRWQTDATEAFAPFQREAKWFLDTCACLYDPETVPPGLER